MTTNPHPMAGYVWLAKLPADDPRRSTPIANLAGAQYQDSHERGIWRDAAGALFAPQSFNALSEATRGRYGIRVPA